MPKKKAATHSVSASKKAAKKRSVKVTHGSPQEPQTAERGLTVVGIGASAGGLEAIGDLLQHLPSDVGMAFVVVQHLDPKHHSMLAELLARQTRLPVEQVKNGMQVEKNHVYVIPPNTRISIENDRLQLSPREASDGKNMPIDFFFRSLARDKKTNAVGVILSGTASDGTLGLEAIKAEGGITFAQDLDSAKFGVMPRNAAASGCVDLVMNPKGIAQQLIHFAKHAYTPSAAEPETQAPAEKRDLQAVLKLVRNASGVDFSLYKQATVRRRIARRMMLKQIDSVQKYYRLLKQKPAEIEALFQDLLIKVTDFFREPACFAALKTKVFPSLIKSRKGDETIRIWVPGCSTGEEAYSIAISLIEYLGEMAMNTAIQIFGTDVSQPAIERARAGIYSEETLKSTVSAERLHRFFSKVEGGYQISHAIRELCTFAKHNLTEDPPFSRLDLVSCRNVLIYMGPVLQKRAMDVFYYALKPTGLLLLGNSESIGPYKNLFNPVSTKSKIFSKKLTTLRNPFYVRPRSNHVASRPQQAAESAPRWTVADLQRDADRLVLAQYSPPGVLVEQDGTIIQFRGHTGKYLEPASGDASLNVLKMAREGLVVDLRTAMHNAVQKGMPVVKQDVQVRSNGGMLSTDLRVIPLKAQPPRERHYLVLFEEPAAKTPGPRSRPPAPKSASVTKRERETAARLKQELSSTRLYLQSIIEEREATNEELKSANEEIQSSNEELQSTNEELETAKEELQSTNEGLTTVNEELQNRNSDLLQLNNDLINLLSNVNIPIVMLGPDLRIRRFTPMAEKVLNLIPGDVGRPMRDIQPNIDVAGLDLLFMDSMRTLELKEREVRDVNGVWYMMRIRPYRTTDNKIDGVVMALFEVDALKRSLAQAQAAQELAETIIETVQEPLLVMDNNLRVKSANRAFYKVFRVSREETVGSYLHDLDHGDWDFPALRTMLREITTKGTRVQDLETDRDFHRLGRRSLLFSARAFRSGDPMVLLVIADLTERKQALEARYRRLFENSRDGILVVDGETGVITDVNPFALQWLGWSRTELQAKQFWNVEAFLGSQADEHAFRTIQEEGSVRLEHATLNTKNGPKVAADVIGTIYTEGAKRVIQFGMRDVTVRWQAEEQIRASLKEKEVLLQELHHRVKNNLQVITSLLGLQSHFIDDPKVLQIYDETLNRVKSIAAVHELLYQQRGASKVDLEKYIRKLAGNLFEFYGAKPGRLTLKLDIADDVPLMLDKAVPCGLILNELISNCLKHAFPESRAGEIKVALISEGERYMLVVSDNGAGFEKEIDLEHSATLGLQLVDILARQLGGVLRFHLSSPTEVVVEFPASLRKGKA